MLIVRPAVRRYADELFRFAEQRAPRPRDLSDGADGVRWRTLTLDEIMFLAMHVKGAQVVVAPMTEPRTIVLKIDHAFASGVGTVDGVQMPGYLSVTFQRGVSLMRETINVKRMKPTLSTRIGAIVHWREACR